MVSSRDKGKRYERHCASLFRSEGYDARRGQQYSGIGGDDVVGVPYIHVECKHQEKMHLYDWMSQAKHDAKENEIPIVIHKKNNCADLVTMEFQDWIKLYREWEAGHK